MQTKSTTRRNRRAATLRAENRKSAKIEQKNRRMAKADAEGRKRLPAVDEDFDADGFVPNVKIRNSVARFLDLDSDF